MKISVVGTGYVGLSLAILLSKYNDVYALDIDEKSKNDQLLTSPIKEVEIEKYLTENKLSLKASTNKKRLFMKKVTT